MALFRKPRDAPARKAWVPQEAPGTVTVYSGTGYGRGTLFVSPGVDYPDFEPWVQRVLDDNGAPVREPIQLTVRFTGGAAQVDANLGEYLVQKKLASRKPVPIPRSSVERDYDPGGVAGRIVYPKPIEVGRPLAEIIHTLTK